MLNIHDMIAQKLGHADAEEAAESGPRGRKSLGPGRVKFQTNGQARRAQARKAATKRRKATEQYRRRFRQNQLATAYLRGALQTLGVVDGISGPAEKGSKRFEAAALRLTERYGSVEEAFERYTKIEAERALRGEA